MHGKAGCSYNNSKEDITNNKKRQQSTVGDARATASSKSTVAGDSYNNCKQRFLQTRKNNDNQIAGTDNSKPQNNANRIRTYKIYYANMNEPQQKQTGVNSKQHKPTMNVLQQQHWLRWWHHQPVNVTKTAKQSMPMMTEIVCCKELSNQLGTGCTRFHQRLVETI